MLQKQLKESIIFMGQLYNYGTIFKSSFHSGKTNRENKPRGQPEIVVDYKGLKVIVENYGGSIL